MPEHTIPESLIEKIEAGRAALVVGAGIGVPSWKQLLEKMNEKLTEGATAASAADADAEVAGGPDAVKDVAKLLHKGNLVRAVGFLARTLGEAVCDEVVSATWATPEELPPVARALARLPFRHVWTTFPGDLLETAMGAELPEGWPEPEVLTYRNAADISRRRRTLIKILGDFESYVVTPKSVRTALSSAVELREYARQFYTEGALVFVGFRYGDPDLAALLDRVFGVFEPPASNHYLIAAGVGPVTVDELEHEHHITVVNLPGKGADETATSAVVEYLDALSDACTGARITLARHQPADDDLDGWLGWWPDDPDAAREAVAQMEREARDGGDHERVVEILMGRVEHEEADVRAALLGQLAVTFENELGDHGRAFTALTAALREQPADATILDEAERLAGETGAWTELVTDVSAIAGELADDALAATYWIRLGGWYERHIGHTEYAIAAFRQAIKLDPESGAGYAGLAEIYRKTQRWAEVADVLAAHIAVATDVDGRIDLYLALGDLCETQLGSTQRAIDAYQAAAEQGDENDDALAALERLYRRDERWDKLAGVLATRADRVAEHDPQRASAFRRQLATLQVEKLGDIDRAVTEYEAALAQDPGDADALRTLAQLYEKAGRGDAYLHTLERLIDVLPESEQPTLLLRLAAEVEDRDRKKAAACYERIIAIEESGPAVGEAFRALERLQRADESWYDLVTTYERHIAASRDPERRVALYLEVAEVCEHKQDDPHRAIEAYQKVLDVHADHRDALDALARLYQRTEAWERAITTLVAHGELAGAAGAQLWYDAGRLSAEHLAELPAEAEGDDADARAAGGRWAPQAERHLEKALELDPNHRDAMLALARLHQSQERWTSAAEFLARAEEHTQNRLERVELLTRMADIADDHLHDPGRALRALLRVVELDPENTEIGWRAADRLVAAKRTADAIPILEMLARKSEEPRARARANFELGRAHEGADDPGRAADRYRKATEADPGDLEAALGLGNALYAAARRADAAARSDAEGPGEDAREAADDGEVRERWAVVDATYRDILSRHRSGLADSKVVEIWYRLGRAAQELGNEDSADEAYRHALELDPIHGSSLQALVEVAAVRGDWRTVIESKRVQIDATLGQDDYDGDARLRLLTEIGDIYQHELGDPTSALGAYLEALELAPTSHVLLHKLLDIYADQREWRRAVDTLASLAEHDNSDRRRAKYRNTAALIARDELGDADLAVEQFNLVLDADPRSAEALVAIDELLAENGDYKALARVYRKMLKRVGDDAPLDTLLPLWTRLGEIYAEHTGDVEAAIAALEVASSLEPDNVQRHEELANLYLEAGEPRRSEAIDELQILIHKDPDRVELYRALSDLYADAGEVDKAYCLAQALVFLGAANPAEKERFEKHRPLDFIAASRRLTEELWHKSIIHPDEDLRLNAMFRSLCGPIAATTARPAESFSLRPEQRSEVGRDSPMVVARVFKYSADILALDPEPHLYLMDDADGIRVANTRDSGKLVPSVLADRSHTALKDESILAFQVAKRLAYFRPERYVHYALPTVSKLEQAYEASLVAAGVAQRELVDEEAAMLAKHLTRTVPRAELEQVAGLARKLGGDEPRSGLISGWHSAADLTANRVAFILANDLEVAARSIARETAAMSSLPVKRRLRDLLLYSVSESYFTVRRHLGLEVDGGA